MSKPDLRKRDGNMFQQKAPVNTPEQVQTEIYGSGDTSQYITADPTSIFDIYPDPTQPRRAIPNEIRLSEFHDGTTASMLSLWYARLNDAVPGALAALFDGDEFDIPDDVEPYIQALLDLIELAVSVHRDGLLNPITVVRYGSNKYMLETGERRWLAYWLLFHNYDQLLPEHHWKYTRIPARIVDHIDVWRQASENSARANLNMVSRARQYAKLVMALYEGELTFEPYTEFLHDRHFYAQVADLRVPRGKNDQLMAACGIKSRSVLHTYRSILKLDDDLWTRADDDNWTENELFSTPNNSPANPPPPPQATPAMADTASVNPLISAQTVKDFRKFAKTAIKAGQGDAKAKRIALGYITEQRLLLDRIERWLTSNDVE